MSNWPLENFGTKKRTRCKLWKTIEPALRLASQFLLSKPSLAFFRRLRFGKEGQHDSYKGCGRNYMRYEEPSDERTREKEERVVIQDLENMAQRLNCVFGVFSDDVSETTDDGQTHAIMTTSKELFGKEIFIRGDYSKLPREREDAHFILVNEAYRVYANNQNPTPCEYSRFAFSLAFSLVHETAHAYYVRDKLNQPEEYSEPFWSLEQQNCQGELGCAIETAVFRDTMATFIHHEHGVEMQWEPVVSEMVGSSIVVQESLITCPVKPNWLRQFLTRGFWRQLAEKPYNEQVVAFYMPEAEEALVRDPVDGYDRWAVRKDSQLAMAKKNFKIGNQRSDIKRGLAKLEVIELYEAEDRKLLWEKVKRLKWEQEAPSKYIPIVGEIDHKGWMSPSSGISMDVLSSSLATRLNLPRKRASKKPAEGCDTEMRDKGLSATADPAVSSTFGECSGGKKRKREQTRGIQKLLKDDDCIEPKAYEKRKKLSTRRNAVVMSSCCAVRTCKHL
ncbi:hypothetical protein G6011_09102 [Alternaria panax]|uniref:Uncharacterized protein n=1 Tax=Alternaria panax TaxID=48097 RepID=A0AAD4IAF5_9PLEO|nr:hypothetical protein G6011_09102 [Alternaria panax]